MTIQKYVVAAVLLTSLILYACTIPSPSATDETVQSETDSVEEQGASDASSETASPETASSETASPETASPETASPETASSDVPQNIFDEILPGQPIPDAIATQLLYDMAGNDSAKIDNATQAILTARDQRFIPVLIELLRFAQIGLADGDFSSGKTLNRLSGQSFGPDWGSWVEWYGDTDIVPPPGFTTWKGTVLSQIDPGFGDFLKDEFASTIRVEEVQWGGVRVDGIPALDQATMIDPALAKYLRDDEPVFGLEINGDARAYPLRILDWHEMANDVVGDVPVSIAYCTLCGAAVAYDSRASDGATYDFGSSGFLFRSNKLMYDRQTRTLWNQLTGEPVLGELVGTDVELTILPIVLTTWEAWLDQHPDTKVLDIDTGFRRPYEVGAAYGDYFAGSDTMFPVWQRNELLDTKAQVYAMQIEDIPVAYPIATLDSEQVVNDTVGETNVVVIASGNPISVDGLSRRAGSVTYTAGSEVRAYERGAHIFTAGPNRDTVIDEQGQAWEITEAALVGPNGEQAPRLGGHLAYWFGWFAFFPDTLVYGAIE
ncbi:MAG: DUF3179 domain-containing protein [Chloroflexota bacterium]